MFGVLLALLAAAVLGTGGAVYAADGASPGSALYGLDRATENVQYALTLDAHDKAELALQNATERLLEARDNAQNGDEEGVTEALAGYDEAYQNAINLLKNSDPLLLKAAFEEQNSILNEIAAEDTCTDVDGDGFDDVTGESCTPPAPTCTDADGDGFDDVTGESCTPPAPTCTDADGDGADDVTGEPCAAPAPTCTDADGDGADDFTGEPCAAAETFQSCVGADPHPVGQFLADQYGVTYETIMGYFCGTAATDTSTGTGRNGFGEIRLAFRIAEVSGEPVENILALRDSGLGWGQIKQQYGLVGNGKNATEEPSTLSTDQGNGKSNNGNGGGNGNGNGNSGGGNGNNGNHGNGNGGGNSNRNGNGNGGGNGNGNGGGHKP